MLRQYVVFSRGAPRGLAVTQTGAETDPDNRERELHPSTSVVTVAARCRRALKVYSANARGVPTAVKQSHWWVICSLAASVATGPTSVP